MGLHFPVRRAAGFTLIEIVLSVFILMLLVVLAVPSIGGVMADRRLRHSLDQMNNLVHQAQEKAIVDHRPYLLIWGSKDIELWPETATDQDPGEPAARLQLMRGESYALAFPYALEKDPPAEWIFWPSGTCEPADVTFKGPAGTWTVSYSPLTARADITKYVAH